MPEYLITARHRKNPGKKYRIKVKAPNRAAAQQEVRNRGKDKGWVVM